LQLSAVHEPAMQVCPVAHALLHAPQCWLLLSTFVSQPSVTLALQSWKFVVGVGAWHVGVQRLALQVTAVAFVALDGQRLPHDAQLFTSERVSTSQPSAYMLLQLAKFAAQMGRQLPVVQMPPNEFGTVLQTVPQAPQF